MNAQTFKSELIDTLSREWNGLTDPSTREETRPDFHQGFYKGFHGWDVDLLDLSTADPEYQKGFIAGLSDRLALRIPF